MSNIQNAVIIEPHAQHKASVIWLHGLGADGHDFEPIVPELRLPDDYGIRFIFPHAPVRPVTINGGMMMRAWYDVKTPDLRQAEDAEAIQDSSTILHNHISNEIQQGIASTNIIVAGFSQGGAIALYAGLRFSETLAGILALSTYLPLPEKLDTEANDAQKHTAIMMAHGIMDPVIPVHQGKSSFEQLKQAGYPVNWNEYRMQHAVCAEEIDDISRWLADRFD